MAKESASKIGSAFEFWFSSRFGIALIGFFGFVNLYALRVNLSVAIVFMLNNTALEEKENGTTKNYSTNLSTAVVNQRCTSNATDSDNKVSCMIFKFSKFLITAKISKENGEFEWQKWQQGLVLSAYYWGYMLSQIPGGQLAEQFGGRHVFGWSMVIAAVATLLCPIAASNSFILLIILRIIIGLGEGVGYPCMHAIWAFWAPPAERSRLVAFAFAGKKIDSGKNTLKLKK